jgi:hypothetical protein
VTATAVTAVTAVTGGDGDGGDGGGGDDGDDTGQLTCERCDLTVRAGESGPAELTLAGSGDTVTYDLAVENVPAGWEVTVVPASVELAEGATEAVTVEVTTPRNAKDTHELTVTASVGGEQVGAATVTVEVVKGRPSTTGASGNDRSPAMVAARVAGSPGGVAGGLLLAVALAAWALSRRPVRG